MNSAIIAESIIAIIQVITRLAYINNMTEEQVNAAFMDEWTRLKLATAATRPEPK